MSFNDRIKELEKSVGIGGTETCLPTHLIVGIAIPLVLFLILYFFKFSFVMKEENGEKVRNTKKIFIWVTVITLLSWGLIYFYLSSDGFKNLPMTCCTN